MGGGEGKRACVMGRDRARRMGWDEENGGGGGVWWEV